MYALQAVFPLLPAKQRRLPDKDWLEQDSFVCCPDPCERLIMLLIGSWRPRTLASAGTVAREVKLGGTENPDMIRRPSVNREVLKSERIPLADGIRAL